MVLGFFKIRKDKWQQLLIYIIDVAVAILICSVFSTPARSVERKLRIKPTIKINIPIIYIIGLSGSFRGAVN